MVEPSNDLKQKLLELTQKTILSSPKLGKSMMTLAGFNRGYVFVTYSTRSQAAAAVKLLHGYEIRPGRYIGVVKSVDNCRLFIEGLPKSKTKERVLEELSKYVGGIVNVILYANCFAFVKFTSNREVAVARRVLTQDSAKLWDRDVVVKWAEPESDIDDEQMKKKLSKWDAKFNKGLDLTQTLLSYKQHLEKRAYVNAPKKAEGNSSECAGESSCGSTEANTRPLDQKPDYTVAPAKLYAIC